MTITLLLRMILQNTSRRVVGNVWINISPSNIFLIVHLPARFDQNCQAVFRRCEYLCVNRGINKAFHYDEGLEIDKFLSSGSF